MSESLSHSFKRFVQTTDSFKNETCLWMGHWIFDSANSFKTLNHSVMKTRLSVAVRCDTVLLWSLFGTIFAAETEQKQSILCLKCKWLNLNCCMKAMSHFQSWWYSGKRHSSCEVAKLYHMLKILKHILNCGTGSMLLTEFKLSLHLFGLLLERLREPQQCNLVTVSNTYPLSIATYNKYNTIRIILSF